MSTKFTKSTPAADLPEPLTVLLDAAAHAVFRSLIAALRTRGYDAVTDAHLVLFGNLDCGATHAAQIAQRMQVSRQAISKTLRELQSLGFVRLQDDPARRNQKLVVMTAQGEQLARDAREALHGIETSIAADIGPDALAALRRSLAACRTKASVARV